MICSDLVRPFKPKINFFHILSKKQLFRLFRPFWQKINLFCEKIICYDFFVLFTKMNFCDCFEKKIVFSDFFVISDQKSTFSTILSKNDLFQLFVFFNKTQLFRLFWAKRNFFPLLQLFCTENHLFRLFRHFWPKIIVSDVFVIFDYKSSFSTF